MLFAPFYRRLLARMHQRRNWAALATLAICLIGVILPLTLITMAMLQEGMLIFEKIRSGQIDFGAYFQLILGALPQWLTRGCWSG